MFKRTEWSLIYLNILAHSQISLLFWMKRFHTLTEFRIRENMWWSALSKIVWFFSRLKRKLRAYESVLASAHRLKKSFEKIARQTYICLGLAKNKLSGEFSASQAKCQEFELNLPAHFWKLGITKFDRLKNWVHTWLLSSGQEFDEKFLDSKHIFKVYFKPGWLKILHLSHVY